MQLVYNGPHPEVVVDELDQEHVITRGEATEIPDELAARLLEQDTWAQASASSDQSSVTTKAVIAPVDAQVTVPADTTVLTSAETVSNDSSTTESNS